jgi:drug/metabolite transporter (DMT)-like permease
MGTRVTAIIYVLAMVAVVISVDVLFLRHHFGPRLIVNIGIVLVFAAFYFAFLRHR